MCNQKSEKMAQKTTPPHLFEMNNVQKSHKKPTHSQNFPLGTHKKPRTAPAGPQNCKKMGGVGGKNSCES